MSDLTPVALETGMLAYYDTTFNGLVPCKVLETRQDPDDKRWYARIKLTATRAAYKAGETLYVKADDVPPRSCVRVRQGHIRVRNAWHVLHEGKRHDLFASAVGV